MTRPRPSGEEVLQDIQVMLKSDASPSSIRSLKVGLLRGWVEGGSGCCVVRRALGGRLTYLGASRVIAFNSLDKCLLSCSCGQSITLGPGEKR